jgi:hypothetical protein
VSDKYSENDRYPIKGWHDAAHEVFANSIMLYTFGTSTIELDSQTVTLIVGSQYLGKEVSAIMPLMDFITSTPLIRIAYIRELKQKLHESISA